MLTAGVIIGLLITYILLRPATPTLSQLTQNQPANTTPANIAQTKPRETSTKPSPVKSSTPAASSTATQDIRWFVVFGTFATYDRAAANARLEQMRVEGFRDAYIVDTNSYSNFTPDRLAVVMGPFSESEARRIGNQVRSVTPTIKPGW
jgi:cell division septation protein DedD